MSTMRPRSRTVAAALLLGGFLLTLAAIGCGFWFGSHATEHAALGGLVAGYVGSIIFAVPQCLETGFRLKVTWGALCAACWAFALPMSFYHEQLAALNAVGLVILVIVLGSLGAVERYRYKRRPSSRPTPSDQ